MDVSKMIHRLKTYQNGVHGDFFLEVADLLTSLITEKEPSAKSPAAMTGSAASVSEIPSDFFVSKVDLDAEIPYCEAQPKDFTDLNKPTKFLIPETLAYYMRLHFCGSQKMHDALIEDGKRSVRLKIKAALGIE